MKLSDIRSTSIIDVDVHDVNLLPGNLIIFLLEWIIAIPIIQSRLNIGEHEKEPISGIKSMKKKGENIRFIAHYVRP